jgi:hypothetical protein
VFGFGFPESYPCISKHRFLFCNFLSINKNMANFIEQEHHFDVATAIKYGVEKAVILYNLRWWIKKNLANKKNVKKLDEKKYVWTYNSARAFATLFPYMKAKSIGRWLRELEEDKVIIVGNFNRRSGDNTKWFTMPEFEIVEEIGGEQNDTPLSQNGQAMSENEQAIPDSKQQIANLITNVIKSDAPDEDLIVLDLSENALGKKVVAGRVDNRHPDIEAIYAVFEEECGVRPAPIKGGNGFDLNRGACVRMIKKYSVEEVCGMAKQMFKAMKEDKFCKVVTNPLDMERNLGWYKIHFERKGGTDGGVFV